MYKRQCLKSAAIQVGKQALFSLSLLAISIAAQGMWGGPAGIIVSIGTGIVIVSYTIADAVHQRTFAEECHIKTIEEYQGMSIAALEEIAYRYGWIDMEALVKATEMYGKSNYGKHLKAVASGRVLG